MEIAVGTRPFEEVNREIKEKLQIYDEISLKEVYGQRYIGAGMDKSKSLKIYGTPGNDLACYLNGGTVEVFGNSQDATGNTMDSGKIIIHGNCGDAIGYAMRGGKIYVRGNSGYRCGIHMKEFGDARPVIVIGGKAGSFLGEYMAGGIIILLGNTGDPEEDVIGTFCGTGMHGGVMYIRGKAPREKMGREVAIETCGEKDYIIISSFVSKYCEYFNLNDSTFPLSGFIKLRPASKRPYGNMYTAN